MAKERDHRKSEREWTVPEYPGLEPLDREELLREIADLETHVYRGGFAATIAPIRVKYEDADGQTAFRTIGARFRLFNVPAVEVAPPVDEFEPEPFDDEVTVGDAA